jgi:hypothetical protein
VLGCRLSQHVLDGKCRAKSGSVTKEGSNCWTKESETVCPCVTFSPSKHSKTHTSNIYVIDTFLHAKQVQDRIKPLFQLPADTKILFVCGSNDEGGRCAALLSAALEKWVRLSSIGFVQLAFSARSFASCSIVGLARALRQRPPFRLPPFAMFLLWCPYFAVSLLCDVLTLRCPYFAVSLLCGPCTKPVPYSPNSPELACKATAEICLVEGGMHNPFECKPKSAQAAGHAQIGAAVATFVSKCTRA